MKKVFVLFTVVMLMAVKGLGKKNGKAGERGVFFDNVGAFGAGGNRDCKSLCGGDGDWRNRGKKKERI